MSHAFVSRIGPVSSTVCIKSLVKEDIEQTPIFRANELGYFLISMSIHVHHFINIELQPLLF